MSKSVELTSPIPFGGRHVTALTFSEPKMKQYAQHGEPSVVTRTADGGLVMVENSDAIFAYARDLVGGDAGVIEHLSLRDTLAVKEVILDFFADARSDGETAPPGSSSPTSTGSAPETSPI